MIRPKLLLAFAAMAAMTLLSGAVGFVFVDRIGKTVSIFSDVTSPLLTESLALADDAQRIRATFLLAVNRDENADDVSVEIAALHAQSLVRLRKLREQTAKAGIDLQIQPLEGNEHGFFALLDRMLAVQKGVRAAALLSKQRLDRFSEERVELGEMLRSLSNRAEGRIAKSEDEVKVQVQTGVATVASLGTLFSDLLTQTYPIAQHANRLVYESNLLGNMVNSLMLQVDTQSVPALEQAMREAFKTSTAQLRRLAGRLRDVDGRAELARIQQGLSDVEAALMGPEGLLASQREVLTGRSEIAASREALDQTERQYFGGLEQVVNVARRLNEGARDETSNIVARGRLLIISSVLLALIGGMGFSLILARRLTEPLARLTNDAEAIRESGELVPISDSSMTQRTDELGILSRSFNRMIGEIASSRQQLIDVSAADARMQYARFNAAINNMPQGFVMMDSDARVVVCNERYIEMYGLSHDIVKPGCTLTELLRHRAECGCLVPDPDRFREDLLASLSIGKMTIRISDTGDGREISVTDQPMPSGGWISVHEDITERRAAQAKISHMALHDALTDLPNRLYFYEQLTSRFVHHERGQSFAVLCFDLDRFKSVNDTLGHQFGDILLRQLADRMRECLRDGDTLARLGGDEFAILQNNVESPTEISALASRLNAVISTPFDLGGHQAVIGVSIGIAVGPADAKDAEHLMQNADMALYRAKNDGRGIYRFFEREMDTRMQERRALELDLRKALADREFELYYQPIINLKKNVVCGFEALLRWNHPDRGLVPPLDFIPLAEETELIVPIGEWVLREACQEATRWPADISVAVNISVAQFKTQNIVQVVTRALADSGLAPNRLELEITESVLLLNSVATLAALHELREMSVRISIDDFGTGYSSLSYLRSFPFDKIKIDKSFVHDLISNDESMAIVRAVTGLGNSLGMTTTGEGVETQEELGYLKSEGCTEAQGYLFSNPKPASEIDNMLRTAQAAVDEVA